MASLYVGSVGYPLRMDLGAETSYDLFEFVAFIRCDLILK